MKKIFYLILLLSLSGSSLFAQSEYRYFSFVWGFNHSYTFAPAENNEVLLQTSKGDMLKQAGSSINYSFGTQVGFNYHIDSRNDQMGFVLGVNYFTSAFTNKYQSITEKYKLNDTYRNYSVSVPFWFKFGPTDIYRNMTYFFVGAQYNYSFKVVNIQKASWSGQKHVRQLESNEKNSSYILATLGFNYRLINIQVSYSINSFVNTNYEYQNDKGQIFTPYQNISKGNLFIQTNIHLPLTRWLSIHNWQAEKIRRKLKFGGP